MRILHATGLTHENLYSPKIIGTDKKSAALPAAALQALRLHALHTR